MFGIGIPELVVILIVGLIIFGPGKLPEVGRAVGKGLREFRKASSALQSALNEPEKPAPPAAAPAPAPEPPQTAAAQLAASAETPAQPEAGQNTEKPTKTAGQDAEAKASAPSADEPAYTPPTQESVRRQIEEQGRA